MCVFSGYMAVSLLCDEKEAFKAQMGHIHGLRCPVIDTFACIWVVFLFSSAINSPAT